MKKSLVRCIATVAFTSLLVGGCGSESAPTAKKGLCDGELAQKFGARVGGTADDVAFGVVQTQDGGFVLAGRTDSLKAGPNRGWAARVDRYGRFLWGRDLGPTAGYGTAAITHTGTDKYLIAHGAMTLVQLDDEGEIAWTKQHDTVGSFNHEVHALAQVKTGGAVMAGIAYTAKGTTTASRDAVLIRLDDAGNKVWAESYKKDALTQAEDVAVLPDGYLLAGWTEGKIGDSGRDFWAVRTGDTGKPVWSERWGGSLDDEATAVVGADDGGFVLAGMTRSVGAGDVDLWLVKVDSEGKLLWSKTHGGDKADEGHAMARVGDNYIITGRRHSLGVGPGGLWVIEVDKTGELVWQQTYGAAWKAQGTAILTLSDGFAVAGSTTRQSMGGNDFWLVRSDKEGQHKCPGALCYGSDDRSCGSKLKCDATLDPPVCQ
ncbi:MAG: hypothetical protein KC502_12240 [Myxococcales bacterium]|nr:hypothetical protein [Myxococcales bacterium]